MPILSIERLGLSSVVLGFIMLTHVSATAQVPALPGAGGARRAPQMGPAMQARPPQPGVMNPRFGSGGASAPNTYAAPQGATAAGRLGFAPNAGAMGFSSGRFRNNVGGSQIIGQARTVPGLPGGRAAGR